MVNPKRWLMVLKYFLRNWLNLVPEKDEDLIAYAEQVVMRSIMCSDCVNAGTCKECGCKVSALLVDPKAVDSLNKWEAMKGTDDWNSYKKEYGITFRIDINTII